jgi:hypothetical protein
MLSTKLTSGGESSLSRRAASTSLGVLSAANALRTSGNASRNVPIWMASQIRQSLRPIAGANSAIRLPIRSLPPVRGTADSGTLVAAIRYSGR